MMLAIAANLIADWLLIFYVPQLDSRAFLFLNHGSDIS